MSSTSKRGCARVPMLLAALALAACQRRAVPLDGSSGSTRGDAATIVYEAGPGEAVNGSGGPPPDASVVVDAGPTEVGAADGGLLDAAQEQPTARFTAATDWPMALYDETGSGHNPVEARLGPSNVGALRVAWRFDAAAAGHEPGPIHATPVVADDVAYVGALLGRFYAIGPTGALLWQYVSRPPNALLAQLTASPVGSPVTSVGTPITGAAVLPQSKPYVIFGDLDGNLYALDRESGREIWVRENADGHDLGGVGGNALLLVDDTVVVGFGSLEDAGLSLADSIGYACCTHRGMVAAYDVANGAERWRFYTVEASAALPAARAPHTRGPSGASIWGQPTFDRVSNTVFVGTGQNFSPTADGRGTSMSDSIVALDFTTGALKWVYQATADDVWNDGIPSPNADGRYFDTDFGDSPKVYPMGGKTVVGAGQKSGEYHVLEAHTGALLKRTKLLAQTNSLGGLQNLGAYAKDVVYQHGMDRIGPPTNDPAVRFHGAVLALTPDGSDVLWRIDRDASPMVGGLAVANGVLYFQSPVEELLPSVFAPEWALFAVDAKSGRVLKRTAFAGRAIASPVVSNGRVYVTEGNAAVAGYGVDLDGAVSCLALP